MWHVIAILFVTSLSLAMSNNTSMFRKEQIVFSSKFNITRVLVPVTVEKNRYIHTEMSDIPSIFFTVSDPILEGGACIYVLEGLAAYEILEGGRDSTSDYSKDKTVYFGAKDGIYKYDHDSLSAKKFGPFEDDIIQLQKANGTDKIYILTHAGKLLVLENNGTIRTKVKNVICASEFVLDTSNNIYFIDCDSKMIYIIKSAEERHNLTATLVDEFQEIKLLRPAFIMEKCIPFIGDGILHILYANGTYESKDINIVQVPSAFSIDAAIYIVAALDGKIYEVNVIEILQQSMFGIGSSPPKDLSRMVISVMEGSNDGMFKFLGLYKSK